MAAAEHEAGLSVSVSASDPLAVPQDSELLLQKLHWEFQEMKRVDTLLQEHRGQWMVHVESWMHHQEELLSSDALHKGQAAARRGLDIDDYACEAVQAGPMEVPQPQESTMPDVFSERQPFLVDPALLQHSLNGFQWPPSPGRPAPIARQLAEVPPMVAAVAGEEQPKGSEAKEEEEEDSEYDRLREEVAQAMSNELKSITLVEVSGSLEAPRATWAVSSGRPIRPRRLAPVLQNSTELSESRTSSEADLTQSITRSMEHHPDAVMHWHDLVVGVLHSARKELRQLRGIWVQSETFLSRAMRGAGGQPINAAITFLTDEPRNSSIITSSLALLEKAVSSVRMVNSRNLGKQARRLGFVMNPTSKRRLAWVFIGMFLMLYDLVVFPFSVFKPKPTSLSTAMKWFSQVYWTLDIAISFLTGVSIGGEVHLDLVTIARYYAKSWLLFDILVTLPLWAVFLLDWDAGGGVRSLRYVRMLRFLRLVRLAKLEHLLGEALSFVNSSHVILTFGIIRLMVYLMLLTHFNACMWFYIGNVDRGWADPETGHAAQRDLWYKYFCAMHWALVQFQGSSEVVPGTTLPERIYAAVFLLFALMILASFVSSLTNMMMQLQSLTDERNRQQRAVRSYLTAMKISVGLSMRVKKYVDWKLKTQDSQCRSDEVLSILHPQLVMELLCEIRGPEICGHKFLAGISRSHPRIFRRLCFEAMHVMWQAPHETIFSPADEAEHMYFVTQGSLTYSVVKIGRQLPTDGNCMLPAIDAPVKDMYWLDRPGPGQQQAVEMRSIDDELYKGCHLCEAALWVEWDHCGELKTITDSQMLALAAAQFQQVISSFPQVHASAVYYARCFLAALNSFGKNYTDILPDEGIVRGCHRFFAEAGEEEGR